MPKCVTCRSSIWGNKYFNADGICGRCIRTSASARSDLEVFGAWGGQGPAFLRAEGAALILTELLGDKIGKVTTIPIASIQEFVLEPAKWKSTGEIKITTSKPRGNSAIMGYAGDGVLVGSSISPPSCIGFSLYHKDEPKYAQNIQKYITDFQANASAPTPTISVADELLKLKSLVDDGILTQEEFGKKKDKLLGL